jgi:predicted Rossmann fold flavoprotein
MDVLVAGGGAAGFFAAIEARRRHPQARVLLAEKSRELLAKVSISGGGRCNVTHACPDPRRLVTHYPRGGRELLGPFHRFHPGHTESWFAERGVPLKTEPDGRMFPVTDRSQTVVDCLLRESNRVGVEIATRRGLQSATFDPATRRFTVAFTDQTTAAFDRLLLATGGNLNSGGWETAAALGHTIEPPVPSLFTFHLEDPRLEGLSGLSVPDAEVCVPGTRLVQRGPLLITHWGLSGPAVLKLSAWGARELHDREYHFPLRVRWQAALDEARVRDAILQARGRHGAAKLANHRLLDLPQRLWERLLRAAGTDPDARWSILPREGAEGLVRELAGGLYSVTGKSLFKEEFVTCGGVRLAEVDFRSFASRKVPGLFFAGEVLDIDGVTGGFNFQAAWTGGWLAGQALAAETPRPGP